jgi:hypothetical protein
MYRCRSIDGTDFKFTLRNFWLCQKPLTLSSSSPLRFTRRSEYLTALNRLRCSGSPLKGSPCAPHPNPTQKFSSSEVVGCLNFEGKFLLSGLRLSAMLYTINLYHIQLVYIVSINNIEFNVLLCGISICISTGNKKFIGS